VVVQAGDVYNNLTNYEPAKTDKEGRTFEKLEVANLIEQKMAEIFELEAKENKTAEDLQEIEKARGVLEYLQGNKNTSAFSNALLKDTEYQKKLRRSISEKLKTTDKYSGTLDATQELQLKQEIDAALKTYIETGKFPPELQLAKGGRVEYQMGGDVNMGEEPVQKIDYETLRARLPKEITDDIVRLIASSPEALEDFATIQTQQDVVLFNQKYDVELVLPAEA
jgi:predicted component of type VI protein secretion system